MIRLNVLHCVLCVGIMQLRWKLYSYAQGWEDAASHLSGPLIHWLLCLVAGVPLCVLVSGGKVAFHLIVQPQLSGASLLAQLLAGRA